jgi:hypothetical protein
MSGYNNEILQKLARILDHIQKELPNGVASFDISWDHHWYIFTWQNRDLRHPVKIIRHYSFIKVEKFVDPLEVANEFIADCKLDPAYQETQLRS